MSYNRGALSFASQLFKITWTPDKQIAATLFSSKCMVINYISVVHSTVIRKDALGLRRTEEIYFSVVINVLGFRSAQYNSDYLVCN